MAGKTWLLLLALLCLGAIFPARGHKLENEQESETENEGEQVVEKDNEKEVPKAAHHELEEDTGEFVGEPTEKEAETEKKTADKNVTVQALPQYAIEPPKVWYKRYMFELFFAFILLCYAVQFFLGKKNNEGLALAWLGKNIDYFKEQFAAIGIDEDPKKAGPPPAEGETRTRSALMEQHSYNLFKFYATGRMNCAYCLTTLELKRRQDLLTMSTFNLIWPELDRVSYEIPLSFVDSFPCVFAVVKRNEVKSLLENNETLKGYTRQQEVEGLSKQFAVLSEYEEITSHILSPQLIDKLNKYPDMFQLIELKDDPASTTNALTLRVDIILTGKDAVEMSIEFTKDVLRLVDHVSNFKMSRGLKEVVQEGRAKALVKAQKEKREEKQEELMKKKADKQKEREAKVANLTPEQQRKFEEKEHKRDLKRQNKKLVKMAKK